MPPAKTQGKKDVQFRLPTETYKRLQLVAWSFDLTAPKAVDFVLDALQIPKVAEVDSFVNKAEIEKLAKQFTANLMLDSAMSREEHRVRYLRDSALGAYDKPAEVDGPQETEGQKKD